ncbi:MAG: acyl-CoA dehydrogenase [Hyphomonadaceae bacterium]|nr:acyl-CoA dehydrogenase [Hyphomonadaceae bacterium]
MTSLLISRRDLDFLLYEWLDVEALTVRPRFADHNRETFNAAMDTSEKIAADHFATHNKKSDQNEPRFVNGKVEIIPEVAAALAVFGEAGMFGLNADFEDGGMQLPLAVAIACRAYFNAANVSTSGYPLLAVGAANLIKAHGTPEQIAKYVPHMFSGRFLGTMCLSEPQAGSSLADITTRAEPQADGSYRLFGRKMWISGGDHEMSENIIHMVLAKIPGGPPGVKGISLFLTPKYLLDDAGKSAVRNDVALAGLNHKMGFRGTVNTLLNFGEGAHKPGDEAGAVCWLVGEPHKGLAAMFQMMNEARIGVGLGAMALGYTGYLHALDYARTRPQGRPLTDRDPNSRQIPIIQHADVRRMLLAQKAYAEGALALILYCARLTDDEQTEAEAEAREDATQLLDLLTPIAKSWPSQWCLEGNSLAIQVHGGYGYTRDYNVEQFYRDNRLNPIHEGTHGIQAIDLLGRKIPQAGGRPLSLLKARVRGACSRATETGDAFLTDAAKQLEQAFAKIDQAIATAAAIPDRGAALANATPFLEAFGHAVLAWIWLEQAAAAHGKSGDFYDGKRQACRYFFRWELPKIYPQLDIVIGKDETLSSMNEAWF